MRFPLKAFLFVGIFCTPVFLFAQTVSPAGQNYLAEVRQAEQAIAADQWNVKAYTSLRVALLSMAQDRAKGISGIPDPMPHWESLLKTYPNNICAQFHYGYWKPFANIGAWRDQIEPILAAHSEPRGYPCASMAARNLAMAFAKEGDYRNAKAYYERQKKFDPKDPFIDGYIKEMADKAYSKTLQDAVVEGPKFAVATKRIEMPNGDIYTGQVDKLDRPTGKGKLEKKNGDVYEGSFFDGEMTGTCVYRFASGKVYEGEVFKGIFHGKGRFNMIVSIYTGDFLRGNMTGKGKLVMLDGDTKGDEYEGDFVKGQPHGYGTYRFRNDGKTPNSGRVKWGTWENGKLIKEATY